MSIDETAEMILVAHQRRDAASCLCGWAKLGASHPRHQVAMLREAMLLLPRPAKARVRRWRKACEEPTTGLVSVPGVPPPELSDETTPADYE